MPPPAIGDMLGKRSSVAAHHDVRIRFQTRLQVGAIRLPILGDLYLDVAVLCATERHLCQALEGLSRDRAEPSCTGAQPHEGTTAGCTT
jgi:hypothetical protein